MLRPSQQPKPQDRNASLLNPEKLQLMQIFLKLFKTIESLGILPNACYRASITLIKTNKQKNDTTRKESCKSVTLTKMNANILNKILANLAQLNVRNIIHPDHVEFNVLFISLHSIVSTLYSIYEYLWSSNDSKGFCPVISISVNSSKIENRHTLINSSVQ